MMSLFVDCCVLFVVDCVMFMVGFGMVVVVFIDVMVCCYLLFQVVMQFCGIFSGKVDFIGYFVKFEFDCFVGGV